MNEIFWNQFSIQERKKKWNPETFNYFFHVTEAENAVQDLNLNKNNWKRLIHYLEN